MLPSQKRDEPVSQRNGSPGKNGTGMSSAVAPWVVAALGVAGFLWSQINQTASKADINLGEARISEQIKQVEERTRDANNAMDKRVNEINSTISTLLLTLAEYKEFKVRKDNDTVRQDLIISEILKTRVTRDEHAKDLISVTDRMNSQRDSVAKIQDSVGGGGVGKQLDNLQAQLAKQAEITAAQIVELRRAIDMRIVPSASLPLKP